MAASPDRAAATDDAALANHRAHQLLRALFRDQADEHAHGWTAEELATLSQSKPESVENALRSLLGNGVAVSTSGEFAPCDVITMSMSELLPANLTDADGAPLNLTVRDLSIGLTPSTPVVRERLELDDEQVLLVEQLVELDGSPLFYTLGYSAAETAGRVTDVIRSFTAKVTPISLGEIFGSMFGVEMGHVDITVDSVFPDTRTAKVLGIRADQATLVRELTIRDVNDVAKSYNFMHFRADRIRLVATTSTPTTD